MNWSPLLGTFASGVVMICDPSKTQSLLMLGVLAPKDPLSTWINGISAYTGREDTEYTIYSV